MEAAGNFSENTLSRSTSKKGCLRGRAGREVRERRRKDNEKTNHAL